jgi:hypothetical protein
MEDQGGKAMMTEDCADILRASLDPTDYSQLVIHYLSVKEVINEIENRLCYQLNVGETGVMFYIVPIVQ